jgi:formate hydrogenlyase transcriptional activator
MTIDSSAEIHSLRATVRDLLALSTIPEAWVGREPSAIATDLADLLIGSLGLDFAFVRLCDPAGGQVVEVTRGNSWKVFPEWLQQHLAEFGQISRKEIVTNLSGLGESRCGIVIPIGVNSERGLVAAASDRPDFPDQIDQQLLSVAANNAATAFQNAFLIKELRSAQEALRANEQALRNARDELEIKVAERTSELQRSAQGLQRSEFYLAEGQRLAHTGSWALAPAGFEYWSSELFQVHGLDPTGNPPTKEEYLALVHPEDREFVEQEIQKMLTTHRAFDFTKRIVRPDGQIRSVRCVGVPATQAGTFRGFVGTGMDVTEQEQLIEAVRKSEGELRQILDLVPQLVGVLGPHAERLYANRVTLSYFGVTLDEWRQRDRRSEVHPDDFDRIKAHIDRSLTTGAAGELEMRLRAGDGTYRWFLVRSNPLRDDQGQLVRWYIAYTDIEDRKRAEEKLQQENVALREEIDRASMFEEIVGTSPALQTVLSRISKVAPTDSTVLITGETGTGKELVARAIHRRSNRASRAFVSVNCAAIPRDLIASELFGHEKGAFTGAMQRRIGRFELAEGGTIFLDEVGELSADTQVALLRVLQEREFERVGGRQSIRVDVRVIAATNRDLKTAVASGNFREDLYYRINVFPLEVPPLRARRADIPLLVEYFVDRYGRKAGKNIRSVDKRTLQLLQSYPWPGNIRELQNIIERSIIVCETEIFTVDESWLSEQSHEERSSGKLYLSEKLAAKEKEVIEEALRESQGRVVGPSGAAAKLGIARSTLESKIQSLNINKNRFKAKPRN